jgi:hypothetical protein
LAPEELHALLRPQKLPALRLDVGQREQVRLALAEALEFDKEPQVRAFSAEILSSLGDAAGEPLVRALQSDDSMWVKAWCVASLKTIGNAKCTQEMQTYFRDFAAADGAGAEVLDVYHKGRQPWPAWRGIPVYSILLPKQ